MECEGIECLNVGLRTPLKPSKSEGDTICLVGDSKRVGILFAID